MGGAALSAASRTRVGFIGLCQGRAVTVHSEYALLCDIVIATEDAYFEDAPHPAFGIVPGDGLHIVWPEVIGEIASCTTVSRPWPGLPGTRPLASEKRTMMIDL